MSMSNYLENKVLDHLFGNTAYTTPTTLYLGVSTTTVQEDGTGITEPTDAAYSRIAITNNTTNFPNASGGQKQNGTQLEYSVATEAWGTITYYFISDAASGGNILVYGALTVSKTISTGDQLILPVNGWTLTLD